MPKTLTGVNRNQFKNSTQVPQPGEPRVAADIETPVRDLLDNQVFLKAEADGATKKLDEHTHAAATTEKNGFLSKEDKAKLDTLTGGVTSHRHGNASVSPPSDGFMSAADKQKLNEIEAKAQVITKTRVEAALGIKRGSLVIDPVTIGAHQTKQWVVDMPGVSPNDAIAGSEYQSNDYKYLVGYHAIDDGVEIKVHNNTGSSGTFGAGIHFKVIPW